MTPQEPFYRRLAGPAFGVVAMIGLFWLAQAPALSNAEREQLAARFSFTATPLSKVAGPPPQSIRPVHKSLEQIQAWISSVGAAVALADIDGDGLPNDACYVDTRTNQVIVAPVPGSGSRYPAFALPFAAFALDATMAPMGCLPGHFKEDQYTDLLVYFWGRTPVVFAHLPNAATLNSGTANAGTLSADSFVAQDIVPGGARWYTNAATTADVDGDGHVDVIVGNYFPDGAHILDPNAGGTESMQHSMSQAFNGAGMHLLLWAGATRGDRVSLSFRDATDALPPQARHGWTLAIGAADLDGKQLPDIYLANDFGPDRLLYNRSRPGQPEFKLAYGERGFVTPKSKALGYDSYKGMGVDFADIEGRGLLDIVVSNITEPFALEESNFVFMNTNAPERWKDGIAPFVDRGEALGLARGGWAWDVKLADFDNSGSLQMIQATGFVRGEVDRWPELQELAMGNDQLLHLAAAWPRLRAGDDLSGRDRNRFFVRDSRGVFFDIADELGIDPVDKPHPSRGIAIADSFGDGRLDFAIADQWGDTTFYRNNAQNQNRFLGLHLRLPIDTIEGVEVLSGHPNTARPSRPAIGATAIVSLAGGHRRIAQVDGGNGHSGKRSPDLHFGLGAVSETEAIDVDLQWRDDAGRIAHRRIAVTPGWHTIILGAGKESADD